MDEGALRVPRAVAAVEHGQRLRLELDARFELDVLYAAFIVCYCLLLIAIDRYMMLAVMAVGHL